MDYSKLEEHPLVRVQLTTLLTEHINRFGNYNPNFSRTPGPVVLEFRKPPQGETGKILVMPQPGSRSA